MKLDDFVPAILLISWALITLAVGIVERITTGVEAFNILIVSGAIMTILVGLIVSGWVYTSIIEKETNKDDKN